MTTPAEPNEAVRGEREESARKLDAPGITAYCINPDLAMPIVPASQARDWMDATEDRFSYRCLPLLVANQAGWFLLNTERLSVTWNGRKSAKGLKIKAFEGGKSNLACSHFGHGILTWDVHYLFRTSPGYNLLVRGPANWPRDGICPLEGLVETDWLGATFSVNWKMTRANFEVIFEPGEPIAMLVPQRRHEIERFRPEIDDIECCPDVLRDYETWESSRHTFLKRLSENDPETMKRGWEKHYFRGTAVNGEPVETHQTRLKLKAFKDRRRQSI